jgi:hypothetical protein
LNNKEFIVIVYRFPHLARNIEVFGLLDLLESEGASKEWMVYDDDEYFLGYSEETIDNRLIMLLGVVDVNSLGIYDPCAFTALGLVRFLRNLPILEEFFPGDWSFIEMDVPEAAITYRDENQVAIDSAWMDENNY